MQRLARMKHRGKTAPFRGPGGEIVRGSIAEISYVRLGGIDQWIMVRGESVENPPLIVLHGGPGMSDMRLFRHFNAPLEKSFTVVHWDQRGTGKSFDPEIPRSSMTVEQLLADLDELVEVVRERVAAREVVIFGHSWGSALGALYAARSPEKVAAYVGCAQVGDSAAGEAASYAFALAEARRLQNRKVLAKLLAIGPPPHTSAALWTERTCVARLEGQLRLRPLWNLGRILFGGAESSVLDVPSFVRGFRFSLDAMWDEVSKLNLVEQVPALRMPVFFFLGRRDHWIPPETSVAYFDVLEAPSKTLVWFDESGHEPFVDQPAAFDAAMVERVRPVVAATASS